MIDLIQGGKYKYEENSERKTATRTVMKKKILDQDERKTSRKTVTGQKVRIKESLERRIQEGQ